MTGSFINNMTDRCAVLVTGLKFPEGPLFAADGGLWAVELKGGSLVRYQNGEVERHHVGGSPNGLAMDKDGIIWFCDAGNNSIRTFDPVSKISMTILTHVDDHQLNKPNDLAFDKLGNLVFTCPGDSRQEPTGYACVLIPGKGVKKITNGKYFPNGLAFTNDGQSLIIAETYKHCLWKGNWNAQTGEWTNERVWCHIGGPDGPGGPDGMAFDQAGNLYVAVYGTGTVRVVNPNGKVVRQIKIPGQNPTNCAFDFVTSLGLVVTEAEEGQLISMV